jgi:hypothetical protein
MAMMVVALPSLQLIGKNRLRERHRLLRRWHHLGSREPLTVGIRENRPVFCARTMSSFWSSHASDNARDNLLYDFASDTLKSDFKNDIGCFF